ncbi:hypothetical protein ACYQR9_23075 [Methylobacterium sp. CM6241]
MKFPKLFNSKNPIAELDADVLGRERNIARLRAEITTAKSKVASLIDTQDDAVALALEAGQTAEEAGAIERAALANAQALVSTLEGSLDRATAGLATAQAQRDTARDAAARETEAAAQEARAADLVEAAGKLDAPVAALIKALAPLRTAITAAYGPTVNADAILSAVFAEAIAHREPKLFQSVHVDEGYGKRPGIALARATVNDAGKTSRAIAYPSPAPVSAADYACKAVAPMRDRAAAIRAGTAELPKPPKPVSVAEPEFRYPPNRLLVIVAVPLLYIDRNGEEQLVQTGQTQLPMAVADEAIKRSLAHLANSPDGHAAAERLAVTYRDNPAGNATRRGAVNLGINLKELAEAYVTGKRRQWMLAEGRTEKAA